MNTLLLSKRIINRSFLANIFLVLIILSFSHRGIAQKIGSKTYFEDQVEEGSKIIDFGAHYTVEKTVDNRFVFNRYYVESKQLTHSYTFQTKETKIKDGACAEYYDDGSLIFKGQYKDGKREGIWLKNDGRTKGHYVNDQQEGDWITTDSSGTVTMKMPYLNGEIDGEVLHFTKEGEKEKSEIYKAGELISSEKFIDGLTTEEIFEQVEEMPSFPGCESLREQGDSIYTKCWQEKMLMQIYGNIRYPAFAREHGIGGAARLSFILDKEGNVTDLVAERGVCDAIKAECLRVVSTMPKWNPGKQNGIPVKVMYHLPIRFRLE